MPQQADGIGVQGKEPSAVRRKPEPAGSENAQNVPVREQRDIASRRDLRDRAARDEVKPALTAAGRTVSPAAASLSDLMICRKCATIFHLMANCF